MFTNKKKQKRWSRVLFMIAVPVVMMMTTGFHHSSLAADVKQIDQKSFKSPEEAVKALVEACKEDNTKALLALFGPSGKEVVSSGDDVTDTTDREWFVKRYEEMNKLVKEKEGDDRVILRVGNDDWPLPFPIVKKGENWVFDTKAGKEEILNRRIGKNELNTIQVCLAYVDAQREYALKDRDHDNLLEYAQKFFSGKGKKDGLYWEEKEGEPQSPLGPEFAKAVKEGYGAKMSKDKPFPYHGYYYRILKAQGKNAPGGAYDYMVKGKMIGGFALVAFPAEYGNSGIMTFIVNQDGVVYEKNLGKGAEKVAAAMKAFDPDETWRKVEP